MKDTRSEDSWLVWTRKKLASQDLPTLSRRLKYAVQRTWTDKVFPTGSMTRQANVPAAGRPMQQTLLNRAAPRWHWSQQDIPSIVEAISPDRRERGVRDADELLARRYTFRGHGPVALQLGEWAPTSVSRTWVRDFNRHHWLATLGFAYRYTGDPRYIRRFIEDTSSWMDQHIEKLGRIWWDAPFEVASRLNAWIWAHFLFAGSPQWPAAHYERFMRGFGLLAEYLHQTIEYHSLGNHIFLEAKALTLCGELFPEFAGAERWRKKGWRILNREIRSQICTDGVHGEGSTMYHRIVAGELAELWRFCVRNHHPEAPHLLAGVERMANFQRWINQGHGHLPLFGDAQLVDTYYRFSAPVIMAARSNAPLERMVEESSPHTSWLLGGEFASEPDGDPEKPAAHAFPQGGYFVTRSSWRDDADVLVWDCGPVGYRQNRKHAHLDALSFTLSLSGTPLLIDPGVHEGKHDSIPLRSTRAHNTVSIDGEEQGILAPRGEIWSPPVPKLLLWASSDDCAVMAGRHDGYGRLPGTVRHTRHIVVMHGLYWLIVDRIEGQGGHLVEQRFHVAPGACATLDSNGQAATLTSGDTSLRMSWVSTGSSSDVKSDATLRMDSSLAEPYCGRPEPSLMVTAAIDSKLPVSLAVVCATGPGNVRIASCDDRELPGALVVTGSDFEHWIHPGSGLGLAARLPGDRFTDSEFVLIVKSGRSGPRELLLPAGARVWRDKADSLPLAPAAAPPGSLSKVRLD